MTYKPFLTHKVNFKKKYFKHQFCLCIRRVWIILLTKHQFAKKITNFQRCRKNADFDLSRQIIIFYLNV